MMRVKVFGEHEADTLAQIERCVAAGGVRGVLCADGHKGYAQPIGGVVAYRESISISGVGFDIACGNMAVRTDAPVGEVRRDIGRIVGDIAREISFGIGRASKERVEDDLFEEDLWLEEPFRHLKSMAEAQLGTVGAGNHYVDVFADEAERIWVGVHFGSRGFGYRTAAWFLKEAGGKEGMDVEPAVVRARSGLGELYLRGMALAGRYAYVGREHVARHVACRILGARIEEEIHNHHNFAWRERHFGEELWVVRKGATPAFPGQKGFVGGSMGDDAVIIEGVESETSRTALYSTVHGAGRVMSRTAARGHHRRGGRKGDRTEGRIRREDMLRWLEDRDILLRGGDVDEAPQAYRRLGGVLAAHAGTIRILHTLRPIGVVMAGPGIEDPYRD